MSSRREATARVAMESSLDDLALAGVLQMVSSSRRSVHVEVLLNGEFHGEISVVDGQIKDARTTQIQGELAFFHLLAMRHGRFRMHRMTDAQRAQVQVTIHRSLDKLLIDAAWQTQDPHSMETPDGLSVARRIVEPNDETSFSFEDPLPVGTEPVQDVESFLQRATDSCASGDMSVAIGLLEQAHIKWPQDRRIAQTLECFRRLAHS